MSDMDITRKEILEGAALGVGLAVVAIASLLWMMAAANLYHNNTLIGG